MDNSHKNIQLISSEIANLWTQYMNDCMSVCVLRYALQHVQDPEIEQLLKVSLVLSQTHINKIKEYLNEQNFPIPKGFSEEDVNLNAPPLFLDQFWLRYIYVMSMFGITGYGLALTTAVRDDICDFYRQCNIESMNIFNKSMHMLLVKGLFVRPPYISAPEKVEFVKSTNYMTGWFGRRRVLNVQEIANIYFNIEKISLNEALTLGFGQVAESQKVREYMVRLRNISTKQIEIFSSVLSEDNLPAQPTWQSEVTNSTTSPFSDKLIMFLSDVLLTYAVTYFGTGMATSMRSDLIVHYQRIILEDMKAGKEGFEIMVDHGWMEQPPHADDREVLSRT
jgi:hypothetical protein